MKKYIVVALLTVFIVSFTACKPINSTEEPMKNTYDGYIVGIYQAIIGEQEYKINRTDLGLTIDTFFKDQQTGSVMMNFSNEAILKQLSNLNVGNTLEDVRQIDKQGNYPFVYAGSSSFPQESYHFCDEYGLVINYENNVIVSVSKIYP